MSHQRRTGPAEADGTGPEVERAATTSAMLRRPSDSRRARRSRRFARLELDQLGTGPKLTPCCPCCDRSTSYDYEVDVFHDGKLGVPEREARGRELALAGWGR